MGDSRRSLVLTAIVLGILVVAGACGRSGFQYIENDDSTVFAKIPAEWEIVSEGFVDFTLTGEDGQMSVLPGEQTLPWRALIDAAPATDGQVGVDRVLGSVEVQPVDRRLRSDLTMLAVLGFDPSDPSDDVNVLRHAQVRRDDLSGVRIAYETELAGLDATVERLILTDDRFTSVYELRLFCDRDCFVDNAAVIDEIMDTFTVEAG